MSAVELDVDAHATDRDRDRDRRLVPDPAALQGALAEIAAGAAARDADRSPDFPHAAVGTLQGSGALAFNAVAGEARPTAAAELALVRAVAGADGSVGRIFDGHLNAVERIAVQAPADLRDRELGAVRAGKLRAGVWGGEPVADEGPPATVVQRGSAAVLRGVKTFCSGAGGLDRALVLARGPDGGAPWLVWLDLDDQERIEVDRSWYRSHGLVASASHRVVFRDTPILARFGAPGAITAQPWFARDALRTAASWAGMADTGATAALAILRQRSHPTELEALAAGRIRHARTTIDVWLAAAAAAMDRGLPAELTPMALHARVAIAGAARELLDEAARACGSRPFAHGSALDRARRDLDLFLLQHRLDPMLARAGAEALGKKP